jgi:hypothetical protein
MKKILPTYSELQEFVDKLALDENSTILIVELPDNTGYSVEWTQHKLYTNEECRQVPDELYIGNDKIQFVQDLSADECKTILRELLREERLRHTAGSKEYNNFNDFDDFDGEIDNLSPKRTLH